MKDRVILHCDCNSFFASVETALNPSYRDIPMAVCGSKELRHGIVLAKNELAKSYGVKTAETIYQAKSKCPGLVIASPHFSEYVKYSRLVNAIYYEYTDKVESFGIDESWLDVTDCGRLFGDGKTIAEAIRERVKREVGITVSVGVSFNKVFAKLGSDYKKPDAVTVIDRGNMERIVYPLPVSDLLYIGNKTTQELFKLGIRTIGDLAQASEEFLIRKFGKMGEILYKYSRGLDDSPVEQRDDSNPKSVGNGYTFKHDLVSFEEARVGIYYLAEEIGTRLRKKGKKAGTVSLTIKDSELRSIQRQRTLKAHTDVGEDIAATAFNILCEEWIEGKPIRMLTVTASSLIGATDDAVQLDLFGDTDTKKRDKDKRRELTVDKIKEKYGLGAIKRGAFINNDMGLDDLVEKD